MELDHLNFTVTNLDESTEWYARVLGFKVQEGGTQEDGVRWAIMQSDGGKGHSSLCMYEYPEGRDFDDRFGMRRRQLHAMNHFALRITDEKAWLETIEREGIEVTHGGVIEWPHSKAWYILDPTGWEIEVALWKTERPTFEAA